MIIRVTAPVAPWSDVDDARRRSVVRRPSRAGPATAWSGTPSPLKSPARPFWHNPSRAAAKSYSVNSHQDDVVEPVPSETRTRHW